MCSVAVANGLLVGNPFIRFTEVNSDRAAADIFRTSGDCGTECTLSKLESHRDLRDALPARAVYRGVLNRLDCAEAFARREECAEHFRALTPE